jgi:hypothetical protein
VLVVVVAQVVQLVLEAVIVMLSIMVAYMAVARLVCITALQQPQALLARLVSSGQEILDTFHPQAQGINKCILKVLIATS